MNSSEITTILESLKISPDDISDKKKAETFRILLKIIEQLNIEVNALKAELQKTRDELNTLKPTTVRSFHTQFSNFTSP
jgi:hypothetical protein